MPFIVLVILAGDPPGSIPLPRAALLPPEKTAALQKTLQSLIRASIPRPLYQGSTHWGQTIMTPNGIRWKMRGPLLAPELTYGLRNHGTWRKYKVAACEPLERRFRVKLDAVQLAGNDRLTFTVRVEGELYFEITQQNWNRGVKLFDGSLEGTTQFRVDMTCESSLVIDPGEGFLPTIRYRLRVLDAQPSYDQLKITHVAGIGGETAHRLGEWGHEAINQLRPSVEKKLLEKLKQKLVKAADTKEIQISLSGVERKK